MKMFRKCTILTLLLLSLVALNAHAMSVGELCKLQGANSNILRGIGIVVGLAGTGDNASVALRHLEQILNRQEINVPSLSELSTDNIAIVTVTATFPPFSKAGTTIDVQASSLYNCESLEGGILLETFLNGLDKETYAVAQGAVSVGGFNASGGGASVSKNHVTVGRIPNGATIEREIPSTITDGRRIVMLLNRPHFKTADNIQIQINREFGKSTARALNAGTIQITIPEDMNTNLVGFIAAVEDLTVESATPSKVVINERTGTIVVGGSVMIKPCQVAHGSLTIKVSSAPVLSQPLPFSGGQTVADTVASVSTNERIGRFVPVEGTSASEVATALNRLEVTARDMIAIFQALRESGALEADLEIM